MPKTFDLSQGLKEVNMARARAHISMRRWCGGIETRENFLAKIFLEIEDNYWFWRTLRRNQYRDSTKLADYYDLIQDWYHEYSQQERGKNEWLSFLDLKWKASKVDFADFYSDELLIDSRFQEVRV